MDALQQPLKKSLSYQGIQNGSHTSRFGTSSIRPWHNFISTGEG